MAVRNLLENAIKFTSDMPQPTVDIGGQQSEKTCILWVRDNGVGFDMKFHDRIFEVFQRLHRAEDYPGTGIGLALVRKAMDRMGGKVWAESQLGQGAKFYLEIPR
jgi:signal transduction histidine kinase